MKINLKPYNCEFCELKIGSVFKLDTINGYKVHIKIDRGALIEKTGECVNAVSLKTGALVSLPDDWMVIPIECELNEI